MDRSLNQIALIDIIVRTMLDRKSHERNIYVSLNTFFVFIGSACIAWGGSCAPNKNALKNCSNEQVCIWAANDLKGSKIWETSSYWQVVVFEAEKRKLSCGVGTIKQKQTVSFLSSLKRAFLKRSESQQLQLQRKLSDLGLYKFTIDGLYGQRTHDAIMAFKEKFSNNTLPTQKNGSEVIIDEILGTKTVGKP